MARQWDYDGSIQRWDRFKILPAEVQTFVDTVAKQARKSQTVAVFGNNDGLVAAGLSDLGFRTHLFVRDTRIISPQQALGADDKLHDPYEAPVRPRATGAYAVHGVDSKQLLDHLDETTVLVGRGTLQRLYDDDFMRGLEERGVPLLVSEPLKSYTELFGDINIEIAWLKRHGWTTHVTRENLIWSTSNLDSSGADS